MPVNPVVVVAVSCPFNKYPNTDSIRHRLSTLQLVWVIIIDIIRGIRVVVDGWYRLSCSQLTYTEFILHVLYSHHPLTFMRVRQHDLRPRDFLWCG